MSYSVSIRGTDSQLTAWAIDLATSLVFAEGETLADSYGLGMELPQANETWRLLSDVRSRLEPGLPLTGHFIVDGSIRGVFVHPPAEDSVELELPTFASHTDWALLAGMVRMALAQGMTFEEEEDWFKSGCGLDQSDAAFSKWFPAVQRFTYEKLSGDDDTATLPLGPYRVALSKKLLSLESAALEDFLVTKVRCFFDAEASALVRSIKAPECFIVPLSDRPAGTMLLKIAGKVAIETFIIDMHRFLQVADGLTDAGPFWHVPNLDEPRPDGTTLRAQLEPHLVPDVEVDFSDLRILDAWDAARIKVEEFAAHEQRLPGYAEERPDDLMGVLMDSPLIVFHYVAGVDGGFTEEEFRSFISCLGETAENGPYGPIFVASVNSILQGLQAAVNRTSSMADGMQATLMLTLLCGALGQLPPSVADEFKAGLIHLGEEAAGLFSSSKNLKWERLQELREILA